MKSDLVDYWIFMMGPEPGDKLKTEKVLESCCSLDVRIGWME